MVLNVLIKNGNPNICGTGGWRVKGPTNLKIKFRFLNIATTGKISNCSVYKKTSQRAFHVVHTRNKIAEMFNLRHVYEYAFQIEHTHINPNPIYLKVFMLIYTVINIILDLPSTITWQQ